ncbi:hypothetical protein F4809DRAFT_663063 [Biscogniauxia mediterranea]|nr:hypothetical protein F4809DRAFT_663063 [Biscogniauxia mediterranea]
MILVVACSFFVRWPHRMPVDPSTIAGAMYYVCDSYMLDSLSGLSVLEKKERDRRVNAMGLRYEFGEMRGVSGRERPPSRPAMASAAAVIGRPCRSWEFGPRSQLDPTTRVPRLPAVT